MRWGGDVVEAVHEAWQGLKTRPNLRQAYLEVAEAREPGAPPMAVRDFTAEESYASVRVVELRLAEARRYAAEFLPMCACFLREGDGGGQRTLPVVLGADTIRGGLGANAPKDAGRNLAIHNMDVVRNLPVRATGLTMYLSLCRFKDDSLTSGLLAFAAEAAKAIGGEAAAAPVRVAGDLTGKLQALLGSGSVETRFARLDGDALRKSGHRLLAASTSAFAGRLEVQDGVLVQVQGGTRRTVDDADYLLLEFRHLPTLLEGNLHFAQVKGLPFHNHFLAAQQAIIAARGHPSALVDDLMIKLEQEIYASPALTERDRPLLNALYTTARRQKEKSYGPKTASGTDVPELGRMAALAGRAEQGAKRVLGDVRRVMADLVMKAGDVTAGHPAADVGADDRPVPDETLAAIGRRLLEALPSTVDDRTARAVNAALLRSVRIGP
ncbi:hypothetical protein GCM10009416_47300 [Craurococcus roseus]|uniref:Uncharacterized protein n=1 Tax=Craurococcus roseus TaxID=77585 RepID=A0ABP3R657_9PROT